MHTFTEQRQKKTFGATNDYFHSQSLDLPLLNVINNIKLSSQVTSAKWCLKWAYCIWQAAKKNVLIIELSTNHKIFEFLEHEVANIWYLYWLLNQWFYLLSKLDLTKTLQSIECLWIHVCSLHEVINILCLRVCRYQRPSERPCSGPVPIRTASLWASARTWPRCSETRWSTGHSLSSPGRRSCSGLQGWVWGRG